MPKPMATAAADRMMHLRSSSKCCIRLMEPICRARFSSLGLPGSTASSGIVIPRDGVLHAVTQAVQCALNGEIFIGRDFGDLRLEVFTGICFFKFHLADLFMNLALEFIAGLFELCHEFT